jgi:subtilisin family serine protease
MIHRKPTVDQCQSRRYRQTRRRSINRHRILCIESLQAREFMAADFGGCDQVSDSFKMASADVVITAARSNDAGSTRATALDLGRIASTTTVNGQVNFYDRLDVFRFEIAGNGEVNVGLRGLRSDTDLIVFDESGRSIGSSRSIVGSSESVQLALLAGTYFVGVEARSFWGTSYQLTVSADSQPARLNPISRGTPPSDSRTNTPEAEPLPPSSTISPLADVAYFGGALDWSVNAVAAPEAWAAGYTGAGVTIAVIDTGVDLDHPDLVGNLFVNPGEIPGNGIDDDANGFVDDVSGYDFVSGDNDPNDANGHGTHVAGTIAAGNNGFGATGIAPDAKILPVRVLGDDGSGFMDSVAAGIRYAADMGADIINLSLGGGYSRVIDSAIEYARALGSFIVAAAGNESSAVPGYPARFSATDNNVLSVGAANSQGQIAGFSNSVGGSGAVQVDAPGVGIYSTHVGGRYRSLSGTSMASPQVAGVAALALSANPHLTPAELRSLIVGGTVGGAVGSDASGQVNAATTVAYAAAGLTSPPNSARVAQTSVPQTRLSFFWWYRTTADDGSQVDLPQRTTQRLLTNTPKSEHEQPIPISTNPRISQTKTRGAAELPAETTGRHAAITWEQSAHEQRDTELESVLDLLAGGV